MSRTFNRDPKYMTGDYAKMFEIEPISSNKSFVQNSYRPGKCIGSDMVCFSLTDGAQSCIPNQTKLFMFTTEGDMVLIPGYKGDPVSSKDAPSSA